MVRSGNSKGNCSLSSISKILTAVVTDKRIGDTRTYSEVRTPRRKTLSFSPTRPRRCAGGDAQEVHADLPEHGILQRVAPGLTRPLFVEEIAVDFEDDLRFLLDLAGARFSSRAVFRSRTGTHFCGRSKTA